MVIFHSYGRVYQPISSDMFLYQSRLVDGEVIGDALQGSAKFWNVDVFIELRHVPGGHWALERQERHVENKNPHLDHLDWNLWIETWASNFFCWISI